MYVDFVKREFQKSSVIKMFDISMTKNPQSKDNYMYCCRNSPQEHNVQFLAE